MAARPPQTVGRAPVGAPLGACVRGTTLIFGAGWLGHQFTKRIPGAVLVEADIADESAVAEQIEAHEPTRVLNCAGRTGRPNVDALEDDPSGTLRSNVLGPAVLVSACVANDVHFTHLSSGCLYTGEKGGGGFTEEDAPNFDGSLYARSKAQAEVLLREFDCLQLRIRLPLTGKPHPRNLLTKLLGFESVVSVPNSVTILEDMWEPALALMAAEDTGVFNVVNPGVERHDELLTQFQQLVDPSHAFDVITEAELQARLIAGRSNCLLSTDKLAARGFTLPDFSDRVPTLLASYGAALSGASGA
jgi:dTDP-4-dehydrorhamnose reductase